jgi:hypothetical protein
MYEIVFPDAIGEAVIAYNAGNGSLAAAALPPLSPAVDWTMCDVEFEMNEMSIIVAHKPGHGEVETLMNALGATAACVRKVAI